MHTPIALQTNIHPYWIYITWDDLAALTDNGRDPPTYYHLQQDKSTNQATWYDLTTET